MSAVNNMIRKAANGKNQEADPSTAEGFYMRNKSNATQVQAPHPICAFNPDLQHSGAHRVNGHIDHEEVDRRHRRPDHVFRRRHQFHTSIAKFWSLVFIRALPSIV
jgi:hypothetical protein